MPLPNQPMTMQHAAFKTKTGLSFNAGGLIGVGTVVLDAVKDRQITPEEIGAIATAIFVCFGVISLRRSIGHTP